MTRKKTQEEFIEQALGVHGDMYDYSKVEYKNNRTKVIIICKIHGDFEQMPYHHLNGTGCPNCYKNYKKTTDEFIQKAKIVHGNLYDYSSTDYINTNTKVAIICKSHGKFFQRPYCHIKGNRCPKCIGNKKKTTKEFIKEAEAVHKNRYNYSNVQYIGTDKEVTIICSVHGEFKQTPYNHIKLKRNCPGCSSTKKTTLEFIKKAKKTHGDIYDYSRVLYVNMKSKVTIKCSNHEYFEQTAGDHLKGRGCPSCSKERVTKTLNNFVIEAKEIHSDIYDYSKVEYINNKTKVIIICKIHGEFYQEPKSHLFGRKCPKCVGGVSKTQEEFIENAKKIHGDTYDYSNVIYINSITKVSVICRDHGEFLITPSNHLKNRRCPKCFGCIKRTTEEFIEQSKEIHGDIYDYSKVKYINDRTNILISCNEHGTFKQTPSSHLRGSRCPKCSGHYKRSTEEFIKQSKEIHGVVYDYSNSLYENMNKKIVIICHDHGSFYQTPHCHLKTKIPCPKCRLCPSCQLWNTKGKLCSYCQPKDKNKHYQKTKEMAVVRYLRDKLPDREFIHNRSVSSECTGTHLFPDILFDCGHYNLIVEVDEHKHRGANYKCDKQRMFDIIAKLGMPCIFIRYNPDAPESNLDDLYERVDSLLYLDNEYEYDDYGFRAIYMFY